MFPNRAFVISPEFCSLVACQPIWTIWTRSSNRSDKGRQMIAAPIEPKASKVGQALAIGFIAFLAALSVWELFAIGF